jgi:flagellar assembly factor FliW
MSTLQTTRIGSLEYGEQDVILLTEGLIGLPDLKRWILCDMDGQVPMKWLQSLDREHFCVPVTTPALFRDGYEVILPQAVCADLGGGRAEDYVVLIIATVHPGGERITGNLAAPLVVHGGTRRGVQLALEEPSLSMQEEIDYLKFGLAVSREGAENEAGQPGAPPEQAELDNVEPLVLSP